MFAGDWTEEKEEKSGLGTAEQSVNHITTTQEHGKPSLQFQPCSCSTRPGVPYTAIIGFETNNQYEIKNSLGQKIYSAKEQNDCCTRNCCGPLRSFDLKIKDHNDQEVIRLVKPLRCTSCCCPCCLQEMEVQAPPGNTLGYLVQNWHPFLPKMSIQCPSKETLLTVEGPLCAMSCCGDVNFDVKGKSGSIIGHISKQWTGLIKETLTDADNFGISFPMDLDVKVKAVLLGACFLIDFMFFESAGGSDQFCSVFR